MSEYFLERAIRDLEELITDIVAGFHIPKKFRPAPFTEMLRKKYVTYLKRQLSGLKGKLERAHATEPGATDASKE